MSDPEYPPVRWYTLARRFPQLVARTHDGTAIPGGPYTVTAFISACVMAFFLVKTFSAWSPLVGGALSGVLVLLVAVYATAWGVTRLPLEGRSPLSMVEGLWNLLNAPRQGRVPARRLNTRAPRRPRAPRPAPVVVMDLDRKDDRRG